MASYKCLVVDYGKERKTNVRQHEKISHAPEEAELRVPVLELIKVDDNPKHEHRAKNDPGRDTYIRRNVLRQPGISHGGAERSQSRSELDEAHTEARQPEP